jgi:nucleoid-associated protein YgaU
VVEGPEGQDLPDGSALEQRVARLERALKRRDEQLSTLRQELQQVTEERDQYATRLKQAEEELVNLKEENEVLKKKIDEILAPPPYSLPAKQDIYVVQQGDTLASIAARHDIYGDRARWKEIFEENKDVIGSAPDELAPGIKLIIPRP